MSSKLIEMALRAEVERVNGWERPPLPAQWSADAVTGYFAACSAHRARVDGWIADNADLASEIRERVAPAVLAAHADRIARRHAEWTAQQDLRLNAEFGSFLHAVGVGDRTREAILAGLDETDPKRAVSEWTLAREPGAMLLLGTKGTGKTVAAAWALTGLALTGMCRCLCDACDGRSVTSDCLVAPDDLARVTEWHLTPHRALFVKAGHLASALHKPGGDELWSVARKVRALVIDDLGREYADQHGRWQSELDLLIDDRHEARLWTLITANLTAEEFKERYGERIADRIRQGGRVVVCTGNSLRARRTA